MGPKIGSKLLGHRHQCLSQFPVRLIVPLGSWCMSWVFITPRFPMPSPSFGTTHANGRQPQVPQSPLRSRSMHVHDDAWGRTSGNASSIDVRRAAACSRRTPVLVVSGSLPALPRSYRPWLAGGAAARPTPPAHLPTAVRTTKAGTQLRSREQPLTCHVKPATPMLFLVSHPESPSLIGSPQC